MAITFVASGAWTSSASTSTGATPPLPAGWAAGDMLLLLCCSKQNSASYGLDTVTGWTLLDSAVGGTGAGYGAGTGNTVAAVDYRVAVAGDTAPVIPAPTGGSTTTASGNVLLCCVLAFRNATGMWGVGSCGQTQNTTATAWSTGTGTNTATPTLNDFLIAFTAISLSTTTVTSPLIVAASATIGASTVTPTKGASTIGADIGAHSFYASVTAGTASAAPNITETQSATTYGAGMVVRIREVTGIPHRRGANYRR